MNRRKLRSLITCAAGLLLVPATGCDSLLTRAPAHRGDVELELPELWQGQEEEHVGAVAGGWLATFGDPRLEALVTEALAHNRDLRASAARLRAAREETRVSRARRLPSLGLSGSGSGSGARFREGAHDLGPWQNSEDYRLSLDISWEVDLWGRLADLDQATREDVVASEADHRGARLSLVASTTRAWINLIAAQQQVELAVQTRDSFLSNFRITERNYKAGDLSTSPLDVQFSKNNVASAERSLISRELARDEARRSLEVLIGRYPAGLIEGRSTLPELVEEVPAGLPSELLMRRPDLVAAAADLRASARRARAAQKNLLPAIRLTAGGSVASDRLADVIADPASLARNVAASISQPLFEGGALAARARQAMHSNEARVEEFVAVALRAFQEVESALDRERSLRLQEEFLETELAQANLAEEQATRYYSEGIVGILSILEAQRRAFNARFAMIALQTQRLQNRIDLFLALGGDFDLEGEMLEAVNTDEDPTLDGTHAID